MKLTRIILAAVILPALIFNSSYAFDDGFDPAKKTTGKYFVIYYGPEINILNLTQALDITHSDKFLTGKFFEEGKNSFDIQFADMLDILFTRVSDILDMHVYSFQGEIKLCRDREQLNKIYYSLFNKELNSASFYVYSLNTIYISQADFKYEIIGHEIAHAIISHYFVVLPPLKIQELLASYVEYQLKR